MTTAVKEQTQAVREQKVWRVYVQKATPNGECVGIPSGGFWSQPPEHRRVRITFTIAPEQVRSIIGLFAEESGWPVIEVSTSSITAFEAPPPGTNGWSGTGTRY